MDAIEASHLAIHCQHLRRAVYPGRLDYQATVCQHPVREGQACIGPFLEDLGTPCRLWEAHPQSHLIPLPQPERWSYRSRNGSRREGFDLRPAHRGDR